jgi:Ni,Fe-hydrogenase maturation factor
LNEWAAGHLDSSHDTSLSTALDLGRRLGADLPSRIEVITIQACGTDIFGEELTPFVAGAVPAATDAVMRLLGLADDWTGQSGREPAARAAK